MKINVICTVAVKYGSLPSDHDMTSSDSETEQDDLASDEGMVPVSDRDDD